MPKTRQNTITTDSEEERESSKDTILQTILKEIREIKQQNTNFREETKIELASIRQEINKRDEKWENDKNNLELKITNIEIEINNKIRKFETKLETIEANEERRQKQERKNNIIIKKAQGANGGDYNVHKEIAEVFKTLQIRPAYEQARHIGVDWHGRDMILVKMRDFEEKLEVLRNKNKLRGIECYIDNDMTKEERSIQATLRRRAKEEAEKGHTVRVGYRKIQINGRWQYLDGASTRNGDWTTAKQHKEGATTIKNSSPKNAVLPTQRRQTL